MPIVPKEFGEDKLLLLIDRLERLRVLLKEIAQSGTRPSPEAEEALDDLDRQIMALLKLKPTAH